MLQEKTERVGTWTMVYDEGLEVRVPAATGSPGAPSTLHKNERNYFVLFKYDPKPGLTLETVRPRKIQDWKSTCTETTNG